MKFAMVLTIMMLVTVGMAIPSTDTGFRNEVLHFESEPGTSCLTDRDISNALGKLASGKRSEVQLGRSVLLNASAESSACKRKIVTALMEAMDKSNLDFDRDIPSYYLWLYGAQLLGELRAVEAVDLLISHLTLTNRFFNSSMNHQPALKGLIKMGSVAIPKLVEVLRHNPDPRMRYSAVYCIATIGGDSAVTSLQNALNAVSDNCTRHLIYTSLEGFDQNGQIKNRMEWFAAFHCDN